MDDSAQKIKNKTKFFFKETRKLSKILSIILFSEAATPPNYGKINIFD